MFAGPPSEVAIPSAVQALVAGRRCEPVWENELGGLTFAVDGRDGPRTFVKWTPAGSGIDPVREIARLRWAGLWLPVPRVLDRGRDADGEWVVTSGVPGDSAVSAQWIGSPATAVAAIGSGLRAMHETLPVERCPFNWSTASRLAAARRADLDPARWHSEHRQLTASEALEILSSAPPVDRLVVCHGDPCAPNTLIGADGSCTGHVDLDYLGVADRWADLAVATWSATWNYGPGWEEPLLAAYGVDPDAERTAYYRLLWDLAP
jgi:kanamycin kinase